MIFFARSKRARKNDLNPTQICNYCCCVFSVFLDTIHCNNHRKYATYTLEMNKSILGWLNATVWYASTPETLWSQGLVVKAHQSSEGDACNFIIQDVDNTTIEIMTLPLDPFMTEFQLVKKRDASRTELVADMTSLSFLNEPEMVECLRRRYAERFIYTSIGPILVAINPFEQLSEIVYSDETIAKYHNADQVTLKVLGPHVFRLSNSAYTHMFINRFDPDSRENQSILINGESGAGGCREHRTVSYSLVAIAAISQ